MLRASPAACGVAMPGSHLRAGGAHLQEAGLDLQRSLSAAVPGALSFTWKEKSS